MPIDSIKAHILNIAARFLALVPDRYKSFLKSPPPFCRRLVKNFASSIKKEVISKTPFGFAMHIKYSDCVERDIALGRYENNYIDRFSAAIKKGDTVIDVGAYCGYFSMLAAIKTGNQGVVYSFEPVVMNYKRLLSNIRLNNMKNIIAMNEGLSDEIGMQVMYVSGDLPSQASIASSNWSEISQSKSMQKETVNAHFTTFDRFFKENGLTRVNIIKIDAEGAEVKIIRGMKHTLASNDPILFMEIVSPVIERAGGSLDDLLMVLAECNFRKIYSVANKKTIDMLGFPLNKVKEFILSGEYNFIISKT